MITRPRRFGKTLNMSMYLARYYGRRVIILLDEYDTPMQGDLEAMNYYMNKVSLATFSHFGVGGENGESLEPGKKGDIGRCRAGGIKADRG